MTDTIDPLSCNQVLRMLDDYVDRELAPHEIEAVRRHLELCAACEREVRFEENVLREVRQKLRRIAVPADLHARVWRAVVEAERAKDKPEP